MSEPEVRVLTVDDQVVFRDAARDVRAIAELDPAARDLEGYLFPETYRLPRGRTGPEVVRVLVEPGARVNRGDTLVMLEAMTLGKPVVASAIPGVQEAVEPDAALVVPPSDAEAA